MSLTCLLLLEYWCDIPHPHLYFYLYWLLPLSQSVVASLFIMSKPCEFPILIDTPFPSFTGHILIVVRHLHLRYLQIARGGFHWWSSWHWLWGLPSKVYPSSHSKVTVAPYRYIFPSWSPFWIPFVSSGKLQFTSAIKKKTY